MGVVEKSQKFELAKKKFSKFCEANVFFYSYRVPNTSFSLAGT